MSRIEHPITEDVKQPTEAEVAVKLRRLEQILALIRTIRRISVTGVNYAALNLFGEQIADQIKDILFHQHLSELAKAGEEVLKPISQPPREQQPSQHPQGREEY